MQNQQLYLKVHPYLWEFYRSFYGSEVIDVKEHPLLSIRIKNILQTEPQNWNRRKWSDFRIIVLNIPYFRTGNKRLNITYRKFLDDRRQFLISQELYADFKNALHNFVLAYVLAGGTQADAIRDFCTFYKLEMNQVKTDSLKKSWDRSELKEMWGIKTGTLKKVKNPLKKVSTVSPYLIK
jgi:hypothetical protein